MKTVTITETKNRLSALLDQVRAGESFLILDRGRPVARLEPAVAGEAEGGEGSVARLERRGLVRRGTARPVASVLDRPPVEIESGGSVLAALLEERRAGR